MKAWGGRFSEGPDRRAADFGRSVEIDRELALDDIAGSLAHVRGLWRARLLAPSEVASIIEGLQGLETEEGPSGLDPPGRSAAGRPLLQEREYVGHGSLLSIAGKKGESGRPRA